MNLDINKILETARKGIEQKDLERFQKLGILSNNIELEETLETSEHTGKYYWIKKCEHNERVFFIFKGFFFTSKLENKNYINLEKYLQSNELNIIFYNCNCINSQETIKDLYSIKQKVIMIDSKLPEIGSCKFENEIYLCNVNNTFSGCEFTKKVYIEGHAYFHSCIFNENFVSNNAEQDICFKSSCFNRSFELTTENKLNDINFEAAHFKQNFTIKIKNFNILNFTCATFDYKLNISAQHFIGNTIDFTKAKFNQSVSFYRSIFECQIPLKETCFKENTIFSKSNFNDMLNLDSAKFNGKVSFYATKFNKTILSKIQFVNEANFSNSNFSEKVYFTDAIFKTNANFSSSNFFDEAKFFNTYFKGLVNFKNTNFKGEADFKTDKSFAFTKEANFSNTTFQDNAYFNNRVFKDFVNFQEADFKKVACFYGVIFEKPVNFSSSIFDGILNLVNTKTDFTYKELKGLIEDKSTNDKKVNICKCISITKDFRDGFRIIKHTLNNKSNGLDASLFHRLELYCKEIELEFEQEIIRYQNSENNNNMNSSNKPRNTSQNKKPIEIFLDLITLKLYRSTSDHHTNLLKIIDFAVLSIVVYCVSLYMFEHFLLETMINKPKVLILSILPIYFAALLTYLVNLIIKYKIIWMRVAINIFISIVFSIVAIINGVDYSIYMIVFLFFYLTLYFISFYFFKAKLVYFFIYSIFIAIFLAKPTLITPFGGMITSEPITESRFETNKNRYNENIIRDMLLDANLTNIKNENRLNFIIKNRKIILERLDYNKTPFIDFAKQCFEYIQEFIGCHINSKNIQKIKIPKKIYLEALNDLKYDEIMQKTQKSVSLLYSFIMLLVIYSLTKTSRRNSVVPS